MSISAESIDGFDVEPAAPAQENSATNAGITASGWNQQYMTCDPVAVHAYTPDDSDPDRGVIDYMLADPAPTNNVPNPVQETPESVGPLLPAVTQNTRIEFLGQLCTPGSNPKPPSDEGGNYHIAI